MANRSEVQDDYANIDNDVRLMLRVQDDDAVAFEQLVSTYQVRLVTILQHLAGSSEQAEDLAQEVFLRVYRSRKQYVPQAKFSTWLFTIANNVASNARRSKSRRKEVNLVGDSGSVANPLEAMIRESSGKLPARQLDRVERAEMVRLALNSLNDRQKMAVLLSKFEGMNYGEIGDTMDMSEKAIKSLMARARANLRDVLQPYVDDGSSLVGSPKQLREANQRPA